MKAAVKAYIPKPVRVLRSIVVRLPLNHPRQNPTSMSERQFDHWERTCCNKVKLKRFGAEVAKKFGLPEPRVRCAGISHVVSCFLYIYEGSGTPAQRRLFREVWQYVEEHAPKGGARETPSWARIIT